MTDETPITIEPLTQPTPKPAAKKPAFKRVSSEQLEQEKQPAFKRVAKEETPAPAVILQEPITKPIVEPIKTTNSISDISSLVDIREYVNNVANGNYNIGKEKIKDLQKIVQLLDHKITDMVLAPDFKALVNFQNADKIMRAAAMQNNIRAGLYG